MIKKYGSFVAGMAAMLLVASLVGSVFAASSRVEYNQAGISLFGEDKVLAGETCKAPNGQGVPSVIIYVDVAEDKTNYLSIRQISKLLGIEVRRDSQKNRVNLGAAPADYVVVGGKRGDGSIPANATTPVLGGVHGPFTEIDPVKAAGKSLSGIIHQAPDHLLLFAGIQLLPQRWELHCADCDQQRLRDADRDCGQDAHAGRI